jgi:hypothetical protein
MELYAPLNLLSIVHVSGRIHSHIAFKNPDLAAYNTKKGRSDASDLPYATFGYSPLLEGFPAS